MRGIVVWIGGVSDGVWSLLSISVLPGGSQVLYVGEIPKNVYQKQRTSTRAGKN